MTRIELIVAPDKRLHVPAAAVDLIGQKHRSVISSMRAMMHEAGGIGLAATQVGLSMRIITIDIAPGAPSNIPNTVTHGSFDMINPVIESAIGSVLSEEGCLSLPGITGTIERFARVTVSFNDTSGSRLSLDASGQLAACIQHEIDHLDGRLFVDRMSRLKREIVMKRFRRSINDPLRSLTC